MTCEHEDFAAFVDVARLTANDDDPTIIGYTAEIRIDCAQCGESFVFRGIPVGVLPGQPTTSVDGRELRAPLAPASDPEFGSSGMGFTVRMTDQTRSDN